MGKDSVIAALVAELPNLYRPTRVITRASDAGGEPIDGVSEAEFDRRDAAGAFAVTWVAHGLNYGVPAEISARLAAGQDVIVNVSRSVLVELERRFPGMVVLHLTASEEVLAMRLAGRGRESAASVASRLARANFAMPTGLTQLSVLGMRSFLARSAMLPAS